MRPRPLLTTALLLVLWDGIPVHAQNSPGANSNCTCAASTLSAYVSTGTYATGLQQVTDAAWAYLNAVLPGLDTTVARPAIVLDIDETSLSNLQIIQQDGFCVNVANALPAVEAAALPPIQPTLEFYRRARGLGIPVFFITGRTTSLQAATALNLERAGFTGYAGLYLEPPGDTTGTFKQRTREALTRQGYRIVVNIGDQLIDLRGGYADRGFLLPNPFYVFP